MSERIAQLLRDLEADRAIFERQIEKLRGQAIDASSGEKLADVRERALGAAPSLLADLERFEAEVARLTDE